MNDGKLKNLFRQFAGGRRVLQIPDVGDLLALSQLPHADEAASPLHADLLRFSRELEPVSEKLGMDLAAAFGETGAVAVHRRAAPRRATFARRGWRIAAAAMAAGLVAAVALVASQRSHAPAPASASAAKAVPDRIFAGFDERNMAAGKPAHGDEIFRADFLPDEIFNSSRPHEG